ncbi:MAG TPA: hypothetical protein VH702_03830 [Vicinamibacterales bacterium]
MRPLVAPLRLPIASATALAVLAARYLTPSPRLSETVPSSQRPVKSLADRPDTSMWALTAIERRLASKTFGSALKNIGIMYYGLPVSREPRSVLYENVLGPDDLDYMSEFFEPRQ